MARRGEHHPPIRHSPEREDHSPPRRETRPRGRQPLQPPPAGRQPYGSPGSGGASVGAAGYGAFGGEDQFGGAYRGRSADTAGPYRGSGPQEGAAARQPRETYVARERPPEKRRATPRRSKEGPARRDVPGGASYGGYGSSGDYGYGARGEYGESQTGMKLPYGQEQTGSGGYTGYGTYGGANEPAPPPAPRVRGPKGYVRPDERIREDICERLAQLPGVDLDALRIEVREGRVSLEGMIHDRRMRYAIEDLAAQCSGVREVENRIRVQLIGQQDKE